MRWRFGIPQFESPDEAAESMTLDAIGERLGVTRERIRQIEVQAKKDLFRHWRRAGFRALLLDQ